MFDVNWEVDHDVIYTRWTGSTSENVVFIEIFPNKSLLCGMEVFLDTDVAGKGRLEQPHPPQPRISYHTTRAWSSRHSISRLWHASMFT